jgi:hypothetical protein
LQKFKNCRNTHLRTHVVEVGKMLANRTAAVDAPSASRAPVVDWPKRQRSATTNDPLSTRTDRNTAAGRRIADLYRAYIAAMGGTTDTIHQANALAAAELKVTAEDARKRMLDGGGDADQLVRLENLAHRAERKLGIQPGAVVPAPQTPAEYLARRTAQRAGTPSGDPA